ncbi:MAG TPA: glycosyltransferase [Pyrinomonadaceae bacterium]|nr:glycosyltransferase [Pyrinomonadaceae bacterium]
MKLDIIIPTYNRAELLKRTLLSLANAELPPDFIVKVTVVDNNSTDETRATVEELKSKFKAVELEYVFEAKQGRSYALNTGIAPASGELLSGVDDDVAVAENWYVEIERVFRERWNEIDFVGGKMLPEWERKEIPDWVEPLKEGVLSWRDYGDQEWVFTGETPILTGGHSIFKREVFLEVGNFTEGVGAAGKNLISCEDDIMYDKLLRAGKRGVYCPQLVIFHFMPAYRLSKSYYRQWCFDAGMSKYLMSVYYRQTDDAKLLGVPRWMYRSAFENTLKRFRAKFSGTEAELLACENPILVFAGFFYAKNLKDSLIDKPLQAIARRAVKPAQR